jgi:ABC-type nickel/cobalt efflux system permease component RcnA
MFSAMKRIRATAGGQRDSPMFASPGGVTRASYAERVEANRSERWLELVSTVLLALATVATAWAAYQSRQWTGEQAQGYSHATATRIAENRSAALANRQVQIDVATFIQWVDAHARHDDVLADFYRARFRDEFKPAFAAWLATKPFTSPQAPPTPFAMPRYRLRSAVEADRLEQTAAANSQHAKAANENADNYMLAVVLFASSLFFAGISVKLDTVRARAALLGLGCVVFLGTLVWALTLPVHVAT